MLFKTTAIVSAMAFLFASQSMGAAMEPRAALIATDSYAACNCPNNCSYKEGTSCKYYAGPSDQSQVIEGRCVNRGSLYCVGTNGK